MNDYEEFSQVPLGANILAQIAQTARDIIAAKQEVAEKEEALKDARKRLEALQQGTLPELMQEAGQEQLTTIDGLKITVKEIMRGTPSKENEAEAYKWLRDHGHGGIIKSDVRADLGKADKEKVDETLRMLKEAGLPARANQSVAWQTLGALVRELMARGEDVPLELLGILIWKEAEVKPKE